MKRTKIVVSILALAIVVVIAALGLRKSEKQETEKPPSQMVDQENKPIDFDAFKGKVVFVNNWASWCPPCIAEMPSIQKLKDELKGTNVIFVMVSFDENQDKALTFMRKRGFDFDVYFPGQNYPYMTSSIPATFIVDKERNLVAQHIGMADYGGSEIAKKLKELAN